MVSGKRSASAMAMADFPAAVGPQMTRSLPSAKAALDLVPGELHDGGSAVHVVRRQLGSGEGDEERAHLGGREQVAGLDRRLAGERGSQSLVPRGGSGQPVARQRVERLAQTA